MPLYIHEMNQCCAMMADTSLNIVLIIIIIIILNPR